MLISAQPENERTKQFCIFAEKSINGDYDDDKMLIASYSFFLSFFVCCSEIACFVNGMFGAPEPLLHYETNDV